jgi:CrcB protein
MARHAVNTGIHSRYSGFPLGIFVINVLGCLAAGLLAGALAAGRVQAGDVARTFLLVGLLGGFTTFSSFGLDTFTLARSGQVPLAFGNAVGQVALGWAAVWVGFTAASWRG